MKNSDLSLEGFNFKALPASLEVLLLADERLEFRHEDYREGLRRLRRLRQVELTYGGRSGHPWNLEKDLKAMLGPGSEVKVRCDGDFDEHFLELID